MTNGNGGKSWVGASATNAADIEPARWVVWGAGVAPPETMTEGDDIARGIARAADPEWDEDNWVGIAEDLDEMSVDEMATGDDAIRGYAPYLANGRYDEIPDEPMKGVLRSDVAPRRKVDQPRPD